VPTPPHHPALPLLDPAEVDRRLAAGWSLPASLYAGAEVQRLEDERVWRPGWQEIGTLADLRRPGDFLTARLGHYPVLVLRHPNGGLRAFMNVCRHRAAPVAAGPAGQAEDVSGNCNRFTCPYHGWTYDLDGRLIGVPDRAVGGLPPEETLGLQPIAVDTWGGIVFVSIAPRNTLLEALGDLPRIAAEQNYAFPFANPDIELTATHSWDVPCNWKVFMENNLECYHCAMVHAGNLAALVKVDREHFFGLNFRNGILLQAPFGGGLQDRLGAQTAARLVAEERTSGQMALQQYWHWPANLWTAGPGIGSALYRIDPTGPDSCRMIARLYQHPGEIADRKALDACIADAISEDIRISSGVQLGLASGMREFGPLLAAREDSIRWFSAQVWQHLRPAFMTG